MNSDICENTTTDSSKELIDSRDNKQYTVFKAKDGNCWMKNNLAVTGTVPKANVAGGTSGTYALTENSNYWNKNATYGIYYHFNTAAAGTETTSRFTNASASICPTGADTDANWVLPKVGENGSYYSGIGSFAYLLDQYGGVTPAVATGAELGFQYGGQVHSGVMNNVGSNGHYWSRTATDSNRAYAMYIAKSVVYPAEENNYYKQSAFSVRCLYPSTSTKAAVQAQ